MKDKLKQINKKYLIVVGVIFAVLILIVVVAVIMKIVAGRNLSYEKIEEKLVDAAREYINDDSVDIPAVGESITITDQELVSGEYIKELSEYNEDSCSGTVTVMNNNGLALYIPDLQCGEYATTHLAQKVIDDQLVTEEIIDGSYQFGLYEVGDEYIFKGTEVNNYVSFGGVTWRIIKIDSNGDLRLIKSTAEEKGIPWDQKYNAEVGRNYGVNDYPNSNLFNTLKNSYNDFNEENKKHLIAHDVCIGSRGSKDIAISYDFDCSKILENQYISTLTTLDMAMASLDPGCDSVISGSCMNYNYMGNISSWTVNSFADTTYDAFVISGRVSTDRANKKNDYYWVIYISGNEPYVSGSGTEEDPYIIEK